MLTEHNTGSNVTQTLCQTQIIKHLFMRSLQSRESPKNRCKNRCKHISIDKLKLGLGMCNLKSLYAAYKHVYLNYNCSLRIKINKKWTLSNIFASLVLRRNVTDHCRRSY